MQQSLYGSTILKTSLIVLITCFVASCMDTNAQNNKALTYLPLGDSYTISTGSAEGNSWPEILTEHLNGAGLKVELLANPARNGFTTNDLINFELPVFFKTKPDFVTICIGTNDWCQGMDSAEFHDNLKFILDTIQATLHLKTNILLLTVPDFSITRSGPLYANGRDIASGLQSFNRIILAEASARGLKTVDLFAISQAVKTDPFLISDDNLHPSDKGYAIWEKSIFPVALSILKPE